MTAVGSLLIPSVSGYNGENRIPPLVQICDVSTRTGWEWLVCLACRSTSGREMSVERL